MKKKKKDEFQEFRNNEKSAYKTFKIPIKSILHLSPLHRPPVIRRQPIVAGSSLV